MASLSGNFGAPYIEGAGGLGRLLAVGLVSAGEQVLDVPATLSARVRTLGGTPHKTDGHDARSTALAGRHRDDLRPVRLDYLTVQIGLLLTRRWQLVSTRQKMPCWVHDQLLQLIPGRANKMLSPGKSARILRTIPTDSGDPVTDQRRQIVVDLLTELRRHHKAIKQVERQLDAALDEHGTCLTDIVGIGRVGAATLISVVGDPTRFATHAKFASFAGVAPLEVSSGDRQRHRVNRGGQRQVNKILHTAAMQQVCRDTDGRTYYRRKRDQGMTHMEALRCLKRQIAKAVWRTMIADTTTLRRTPPRVSANHPCAGNAQTRLLTKRGFCSRSLELVDLAGKRSIVTARRSAVCGCGFAQGARSPPRRLPVRRRLVRASAGSSRPAHPA